MEEKTGQTENAAGRRTRQGGVPLPQPQRHGANARWVARWVTRKRRTPRFQRLGHLRFPLRHRQTPPLERHASRVWRTRHLDAAPYTIDLTYKDVYTDMTKIIYDYAILNPLTSDKSNEDGAKQIKQLPANIMNFSFLTGYLQNVTLSGFDNPLTAVQSSEVFENLERSHSTNAIKIEQFSAWYKKDEEKELRADLKNKRVFAYLLEELSQKDEILDGEIEGRTQIITGNKAKKIIIDMRLGEDDIKGWEKLEKEMNKSKIHDLNLKGTKGSISASVINISPRSNFSSAPLDKAKNAINNLTGFMSYALSIFFIHRGIAF